MPGKKITAALLSIAFILTFSLSAFAEDTTTTASTKSLDQKIQRLQNAKTQAEKLAVLKTEIKTIRDLHQNVIALRQQLNALHKDQLRPALQQARQAKNYDALIQALIDLKQVQANLESVKQLTEQNTASWDKMRGFRESKDFDGAMAALKQIESNINAKISAYNKAITAMNQTISDLKAPAKP